MNSDNAHQEAPTGPGEQHAYGHCRPVEKDIGNGGGGGAAIQDIAVGIADKSAALNRRLAGRPDDNKGGHRHAAHGGDNG